LIFVFFVHILIFVLRKSFSYQSASFCGLACVL
jgi:hypothetical protein